MSYEDQEPLSDNQLSQEASSSFEEIDSLPLPDVLKYTPEDLEMMLKCTVHVGASNLHPSMSRYVYTRASQSGNHIIDIRKTWEKLVLAARVIAAVDTPQDICAVALNSARSRSDPLAQRAVLKFASHIGAKSIAGNFTPGTFTNQMQANYFEPRVLVASDPIKDQQPILEASYVNMAVIAFVNVDTPLTGVDVAIPCNTNSSYSVALMYWLLVREVLRLKDIIPRDEPWAEMVDMFLFKKKDDKQGRTVTDKSGNAFDSTFREKNQDEEEDSGYDDGFGEGEGEEGTEDVVDQDVWNQEDTEAWEGEGEGEGEADAEGETEDWH